MGKNLGTLEQLAKLSNMKKLVKRVTAAMLTVVMLISAASPAMAEYVEFWRNDSKGRRYVYTDSEGIREDYATGWTWLPPDENETDVTQYPFTEEYRCYYFDENGYLFTGDTTPDGYQINKAGEWLENGTPARAYGIVFFVQDMYDTGDAIIAKQAWEEENPKWVRFDAATRFTYPDSSGLSPLAWLRDGIAKEKQGVGGLYVSAWYLLRLTGDHVDEIINYGHWD